MYKKEAHFPQQKLLTRVTEADKLEASSCKSIFMK